MKSNYEITAVNSSKYSDKNSNMLSRIQIAVAKMIEKQVLLPKFVIMVLDDDLIEFLQYKNYGVSAMYGAWIEWLVSEIRGF